MTDLTLHLTPDLINELTGAGGPTTSKGVWAYIYNNNPIGGASNLTTLVDNGVVQIPLNAANNDYETVVNLTDSTTPTNISQEIYVIVQSENPATHNDLTSLITSEASINLANAEAWNFTYNSFEDTIKGNSFDTGDLTAISGFGVHLAVNVPYSNGSSDSRGYNQTASGIEGLVQTASSTAIINFPSSSTGTPYSPLDGTTQMAISPTGASTVTPSVGWSTTDWNTYLDNFGTLTDVELAGFFNGATDSNNVYHNGGYFAYTVTQEILAAGAWGAAGTYYQLSPEASSQIKGYILISQANLGANIYSPGGASVTATVWQDGVTTGPHGAVGPTVPYLIPGNSPPNSNVMNTGANNEWGKVFTELFTGFTGGYYGATAKSVNPLIPAAASATNQAGGSINLDQNINWDPAYAFDGNRTNTVPTYQHNDPYSAIFFDQSNVYGSAYSDNLTSGFTKTPLISLWDPTANADVSNFDLYAYGSTEQDPYYQAPVNPDYVPLPAGQADYAIPAVASTGSSMVVSANVFGMILDPTAKVQLGIYKGSGAFDYVDIPASKTSGIWQNFNIAGGPGSWSITSGGTNNPGTFVLNNLPVLGTWVPGDVYWYQLVVSDKTGGDKKTFDIYATAGSTPGDFTATGFGVDGLGTVTPAVNPASFTVTLNVLNSLAPALLVPETDSQYLSTLAPPPTAPVAGTVASTVFTAIAGQSSDTSPTVSVSANPTLAFGWTGLNNDASMGSWISAYTNKIHAGNTAMISIVQDKVVLTAKAVADLDGQWQTPAAAFQLGNGTFAATMTEQLPSGAQYGIASAPLTIDVSLTTEAIEATGDGHAVQFVSVGGSVPDGNWIRLDQLASNSSLPRGASLLLYGTDNTGALVGRDGETGAGVTLEEATLATIGSTLSDSGARLLTVGQSLYLPGDGQLHFAVLNSDGTVNLSPQVAIASEPDGSLHLNVGGLGLSAIANNDLSDPAYLASTQRTTDQPLVYLTQGETVGVEVAGSSANTNTVGFVRIDVDATTGDWSVGGVAYGDTPAFTGAVRGDMDTGFSLTAGGRAYDQSNDWTVAGASGFYAPVMLSQNGDTFVIGTANTDGMQHIKVFGENVFGIEDLTAAQGSDFDFNDMIVKLTPKP